MAPTLTQGAGRLPRPAFSLIGRHAELAPLVATFADPDARLLTLTGPPGVGKTRLALAVAAEAAPRFADGVVFVDLAPVQDPGLVLGQVARALGLPDAPGGRVAARVIDALADKECCSSSTTASRCSRRASTSPSRSGPARGSGCS